MFSYRQVYIFYHAHFEPLLNQKLPCNELVGVFGCFCTTVLHCCWISKSGTKIVKKRANRFTRVLQFSGNNYFFLKNRKFLQKRGRDRFSAGVSGLTRRPVLCRSASYINVAWVLR